MHILCPHCRNPIELVRLTPREEIACPSCGSSFHLELESTTGPDHSAGQKIGKFELVAVLGHGAFGTVYKARDPELDRTVALKVPRAGNLAGPHELDRFLREARSAAQLRHPSIVSIHEVGQEGGLPYLVSDFVQGVTLADLLSARRPSFRELAELIAAIADALQYAHERGVIHRDVKPSNVMIGDDGAPHVMDFGLAKREAGEITMTVEGEVLGTPAYMSPEQARGEAHAVDGRSDVYSLGVVLYQMLTGELPFRGTTRMLLHQVLHDDPRPPRRLNDRIPRDLETICLKAMAKEPAARYQSARDLALDLRRWLKGEPIRARPVGRTERVARWVRRHPAAAALLGVSGVAVLALVGLAVGLFSSAELSRAYEKESSARLAEEEQRTRAEDALGVAEAARRGESRQRHKAVEALALAERLGYFHSVSLADVALRDNDTHLAALRLRECDEAQRGWEWRYLNAQLYTELFTLTGNVTFSPDGARMAAAATGPPGGIRICDARTGREVLALEGLGPLGAAVFSPDGTRVAVAPSQGGVVRVYDAGTGKEAFALQGRSSFGPPVFSPDGSRLAAGASRVVWLYDARTGQEVLTLHGPEGFAAPVFSPDGSHLAIFSEDLLRGMREVRIYHAPREAGAWQAQRHKALLEGVPAWHRAQGVQSQRAGRWFAAAFHWGQLARAEPGSGQPHLHLGIALAHLGRAAESRQELAAALALKADLGDADQADAHAMLGQWDDAARLFRKAAGEPGASAVVWQRHALLRLQQGDQEGYRQACARMIERFGKATDASTANTVAWACALGPDALPDLKPALQLASVAVLANSKDPAARNTLGAALYRAGRCKEAVAELGTAVKLSPGGGTASDFLFLALAHHRLGDADEARKRLEQARQAAEKSPPLFWSEQLEVRLLLREAEATIPNKAKDEK